MYVCRLGWKMKQASLDLDLNGVCLGSVILSKIRMKIAVFIPGSMFRRIRSLP